MTHVFRFVFTGPTGFEAQSQYVADPRDDAEIIAERVRRAYGYVDARLNAIDGVPVPEDGPNE
jgi:hypothetical protein